MRFYFILLLLWTWGVPAPEILDAKDEAPAPQVSFTISLLKHEYSMCEEVTLFAQIVNLGSDALRLPEIDEKDRSWIDIEISDAEGNHLTYTGIIPTPVGPKELTRSVPPGDTTVFTINLIDGYGLYGGWRQRYPPHFPLGSYSAVAKFNRKLESNSVALLVTPLAPFADSLIAEAWHLPRTDLSASDKVQRLAAIVDSHPDIPVASRICVWLLYEVATKPEFEQTKEHYWRTLLSNFPASSNFSFGIRFLCGKLTDSELVESLQLSRQRSGSDLVDLLIRKTLSELGKQELCEEVMAR